MSSMQVQLGSSGLRVSRICLGMMSYGDPPSKEWMLPEAEAEPIVRRAVEAGITFFDTADMYSDGGSERLTGRLLPRFFSHRDDYVLATKVYFPTGPGANDRGLSRKHVLAAIDASLSRLGTDYADLYQIHRWDPRTPIAETREALHDVVRAGSDAFADTLYEDADFDVVDAVRAVAAERDLPPAQIALAWLQTQPAVTAPIVGATKMRHLEDAISSLDVKLIDEEVARLEAPYRPHSVLGH